MKEAPQVVDGSLVEKEVGKIRFLSGITNRPELFLYAQNKLLYGGVHSFIRKVM